jgi:plasmid stabilization system protein ParE
LETVRPLKLRYTVDAQRHLASIQQFIVEQSPAASRAVGSRIRLALEMLCDFPDAGRPGQIEGTKEWVVRGMPYIVVYEILRERPDELVVLGVFHGAQERP